MTFALVDGWKRNTEGVVQAPVDVDLWLALTVWTDEDHRDLVGLRERHNHSPIASEIEHAEAFDLVALEVVVGGLAAAPFETVHRALGVAPDLAAQVSKVTVGDPCGPDLELRHP